MVLNLQAQLSSIQEWILEVVAGAEYQDVGQNRRAILKQEVLRFHSYYRGGA